ncbi:MAG: zinc metallopeptidase [Clostridia bacterium]|nr:zinc metallopeptidase [Clostridia bacterium]
MIDFSQMSTLLQVAFIVVGSLLVLATIASVGISIMLFMKYIRFNRKENSLGMTGQDIARKILDENGLEHIRVKCTGSILFGNSYSHYFKKVRLRRLTWKKKSVTSLAMASQKSCLAILDKEQDPDMVHRVKMTPWIYFGPLACVPIILIGVVLDILVFGMTGIASIIAACVGLAFYALSFVMSVKVLKTEIKAQQRAMQLLRERGMATEDELEDLKELFKLYNIEYINDMIIALLELIWRILQIVAMAQSGGSSNSSSS